jgi:hypothetical protein
VTAGDQPDNEFAITTLSAYFWVPLINLRTSAFYREVLGFEIRRLDGEENVIEVVSG